MEVPAARTKELTPADSISNAARHNFRANRAEQGWDNDPTDGELGWNPPGKKEVIVDSGNAEVGVSTVEALPEKETIVDSGNAKPGVTTVKILPETKCAKEEEWTVVKDKKWKGRDKAR